jgi:hypothetical protein
MQQKEKQTSGHNKVKGCHTAKVTVKKRKRQPME